VADSTAKLDWDGGNREKRRKHGVAIEDIEAILSGDPLVAPDMKHAALEDRLIAIGRSRSGRPIFIAFTLREKDGRTLIRPVSARYMHRREAERYEKESPKTED
jgi:uncharacterized DUF497 family protein